MITIPGIELAVFKEERKLPVGTHGQLGQMSSGHIILDATIPVGSRFSGFIRHGNDTYIAQRDWANLPEYPKKSFQQEMKKVVAARSLPAGTKVYGVKMPLEVSDDGQENFTSYPNNMLCLAELVMDSGKLTNLVNVWKVAVVSQHGEFFLTVQKAYDGLVCVRADDGDVWFPRLAKHESLNDLLVGLMPEDAPFLSSADYVEPEEDLPNGLGQNEGIVTSFYEARGIGTIVTYVDDQRVNVRVWWGDAPIRNGRKFLVPGERVAYDRLEAPFQSKRETSLGRQARGISLV